MVQYTECSLVMKQRIAAVVNNTFDDECMCVCVHVHSKWCVCLYVCGCVCALACHMCVNTHLLFDFTSFISFIVEI